MSVIYFVLPSSPVSIYQYVTFHQTEGGYLTVVQQLHGMIYVDELVDALPSMLKTHPGRLSLVCYPSTSCVPILFFIHYHTFFFFFFNRRVSERALAHGLHVFAFFTRNLVVIDTSCPRSSRFHRSDAIRILCAHRFRSNVCSDGRIVPRVGIKPRTAEPEVYVDEYDAKHWPD